MRIVFLVLLASSFFTATASAQDKTAEEEARLTGKIGLGVIYINSANNLNPGSSDKYLEDINKAPAKESSVVPGILPQLSYDVASSGGLKFYLSTRPPIDEVGGFTLNLGATYPLFPFGIADLSFIANPFERAYKNPYLEGVDRESTATSSYGLRFGLNRVAGTGLRVAFILLNRDVDEDIIGRISPELGRDGNIYAFNLNYSFYPSSQLEIRPRISLRKGDFDGEANSFNKIKASLEGRYSTGRLGFMPSLSYTYSDYDEDNPVFSETREAEGFGLQLLTSYAKPMGWENWSAQLLLSYKESDANIDFYDTESYSAGAFLTYSF